MSVKVKGNKKGQNDVSIGSTKREQDSMQRNRVCLRQLWEINAYFCVENIFWMTLVQYDS